MDRLEAMALFVTAVDEGSLAAAARWHGRSPASVTRAVSLLEGFAGEALLLRSTRQLHLTSQGERHLAIWRDVLARLGDIRGADPDPAIGGNLSLTAPELFGRQAVMPILGDFLGRHALINARVLLVNRIVDLFGEGIDLAVRLARLPDSTLTAIPLGEVRTLVCAAPAYLARTGLPHSPHELSRHSCIGLNADGNGELWAFGRRGEQRSYRQRSIRVPCRLSVNHAGAAIDAALLGNGLIRSRSYQVAGHLAEGRLVTVLEDYEPRPDPAHLLFHPARGRQTEVRAFIDEAVPALRKVFQQVAASLSVRS